MSIETITIIISFFGEAFGTITGLGNATFFVPALSYFTDFSKVLGIVAFLHVFSNITRMTFFWKNISREVFIKFGISNIILVSIGALFTRFISANIIEMTLGILLILFSFYELFFKHFKFPQSTGFEAVSGGVAGFLGGIAGTSGPFRSFVLINMGLSKEVYIATSVAVDFIGDVLRLFIYISNGFVNQNTLALLPGVFIASLIGAFVGKKMLETIPSKVFVKVVICTLLILGVSLVTKNLK